MYQMGPEHVIDILLGDSVEDEHRHHEIISSAILDLVHVEFGLEAQHQLQQIKPHRS